MSAYHSSNVRMAVGNRKGRTIQKNDKIGIFREDFKLSKIKFRQQ